LDCSSIQFSGHAIARMFQRALSKNAIRRIILEGEVIAEYPDDCPYPSYLLLGYCEDEPIHIVVAKDKASGKCFIVTAYKPDCDKWSEDFRSRRQQ
jgi:hypothetical protein